MITIEFITALFYEVDEQLYAIPKHPEAHLWPSAVVTLGLLHALKGVGNQPFYRWLTRDYRALFPRLPERTRLFRLLKTHQDWTRVFLAAPTVLGVIDTSLNLSLFVEGRRWCPWAREASKRFASLQAMRPAIERRHPVPPPDYTRYKLG